MDFFGGDKHRGLGWGLFLITSFLADASKIPGFPWKIPFFQGWNAWKLRVCCCFPPRSFPFIIYIYLIFKKPPNLAIKDNFSSFPASGNSNFSVFFPPKMGINWEKSLSLPPRSEMFGHQVEEKREFFREKPPGIFQSPMIGSGYNFWGGKGNFRPLA